VRTAYPFAEEPHFTIHTKQSVRFPLRLRIPDWAEEAVNWM